MKPGDRVGSRFHVEREVKAGGMGTVYRALDLSTGEPVALKLLEPSAAPRFKREAGVLARLEHPGIVKYVSHGEEDGNRYIVMEWLEGEDLERRLKHEGLTVGEAVQLARGTAAGLGAAHARGVVHRDVKPANLFLVDGRVDRVKVVDFGIARTRRTVHSLTSTGMALGTPGYMAPEQARGEPDVDARADVFSLGCVLFECLTGRPAFSGEHVMAILAKILLEPPPRVSELADVPKALDELVARLLSKERDKRPRDGRYVAEELAAIGVMPDGPRVAVGAPSRPRLTQGERRFVSVLLLSSPVPAGAEDVSVVLPSQRGGVAGSSDAGTAPMPEAAGWISELGDIAREHGAKLERLLDGAVVLTVQGQGVATDQAMRAASCSLALSACVPDARIALATGRAVMAPRAPMGEAIDRAAALLSTAQAIAEPHVRVDDVTAGLLDARFDVGGDRSGLVLRGRRELETPRTLLGKATPCVGRATELAMLGALVEQCISEPMARPVLMTAAPGTGKSRLATELVSRVRGRDDAPEIWSAASDPLRAGSAFGLVAQLVRRTAGVLDGESGEVRERKLRARVGRHLAGADAERVGTFLAEATGLAVPDSGRPELAAARRDPKLMAEQISRAFEAFVRAEVKARPLVMVLEDLHWGDLPSVRALDLVLTQLKELPLFVLGLARPEIDDVFPDLWVERDVHRLRLAGLGKKAALELVSTLIPERLAPEAVDLLVSRAAGNPFHLEELIRAVSEGHGDRLPDTVLAMLESRLEALDPEPRSVLRAASVFGQVFWIEGVAALVGGEERAGPVLRAVEVLVGREIVAPRLVSQRAGRAEYAFHHGLLREAAYATLTDSDRELGHRLAGEWLEAAGEPDARVLAEHHERGGVRERAAKWHVRAAEQATGGDDAARVLSSVERAVACGAEGELLGRARLVQAQALRWRGDNPAARWAGEEACELLPRGGPEWGAALSEAAIACGRLGDVAALETMSRELCALLDEVDQEPNAATIAAAAGVSTLLSTAGRYDLTDAPLDAAARAVRRSGELPAWASARVLGAQARQRLVRGDPATYLELSMRAAQAFEAAGDLKSACHERSHAAFAQIELGLYAEAEAALRRALEDAHRLGIPVVVAGVQHNLGWALGRQGTYEEGIRVETEARRAFGALGDRRTEGLSRVYVALMRLAQGDAAGAESELDVEMAEFSPPLRVHALGARASARRALGRVDDAWADASAALALLEELGEVEEGEALVRLAYVEAAAAKGRHDDARAALDTAKVRLHQRAERITDVRLRDSFLRRIPEHARTLDLAL